MLVCILVSLVLVDLCLWSFLQHMYAMIAGGLWYVGFNGPATQGAAVFMHTPAQGTRMRMRIPAEV